MTPSDDSTTRYIKLTRRLLGLFYPSALILGLAMAIWPGGFWQELGVDSGSDKVVGVLYGCVLFGVGFTSWLARRDPQRHASLLLLVGVYKTAAVLALLLHGWWHSLPWAGWIIAVLYGLLAAACLWLYRGLSASRTASHD